MAGVAAASWSPDMGSWGPHGAAPPSNGTWADSYATTVLTAYTTYCPKATEITHGGVTYTATEATTLVRPSPAIPSRTFADNSERQSPTAPEAAR